MKIEAKRHSYNDHLYVEFPDFKESGNIDKSLAWKRVEEAGFTVSPNGISKMVSRHVPHEHAGEKGYGGWTDGPPGYTEHCRIDIDSLAHAALSLPKDELLEMISQAFEVYQSAQEAYESEKAAYREKASKRGRTPITGEKRDKLVSANVTPELKEWAASQPEGISKLIQQLLLAERERRTA